MLGISFLLVLVLWYWRIAPWLKEIPPDFYDVARQQFRSQVLLIFGGFLAVLLGCLFYLTRKARAQAKQLVLRMEDLARKNEEIASFVYVVSHDLREPLINIQGFVKELVVSCRQLTECVGSTVFPQQTVVQEIIKTDIPGALHYITASTESFQRLIDAMLRLSRVGRQDYRLEEIEIATVAQATVDSVRQSIQKDQAQVRIAPLPRAVADTGAIAQVFSNLIINAVKYRHPDRLPLVEIGGENDNGMSHYWVRDNGLGIPETAKNQLFQIFQRFHPVVAQGEGLGLATVKRIVERHGGKVWAESQEGVGTTFHFTLPGTGSEH
jgi:signal transduction histidine kinase